MKSLEKLFTSFEAADVQAAKKLMSASGLGSDSSTLNAFTEIVNLLYPTPAGSFLHGEDFWKKIKEVSTPPSGTSDDDATKRRQAFAKLFRVYYADLGPNPSANLESEITQFYEEARPSAVIGYDYTKAKADEKYKLGYLRDMLSLETPLQTGLGNPTSLMYVLVDSPTIDVKMRNANKAEIFLNYIPSIVASQLTPYMSAEFSMTRNITEADQSSDRRPLNAMSPLRFLMGDTSPRSGTADAMMYDAAIRKKFSKSLETDDISTGATRYQDLTKGTNFAKLEQVDSGVKGTSVSVAGMEMFTMPQTLVNMDYSQEKSPRYNPVLNPTLPFGTITTFTMNVAPSVGVMSFKTAAMTLKIFDKSRLPEIADFLNPKLYQAVTIWITYGWIAPATYGLELTENRREVVAADVNTYYDFINDNMIRREAYGVRNTGMTIENDGTVTVNLSLYTKSAQNILEATDANSMAYDAVQSKVANDLQRLSQLAKNLGLQAFVDLGPDMRGSTLISSALSANLTTFDSQDLTVQFEAVKSALAGRQGDAAVGEFLQLLTNVYQQAGATNKPGQQAKLAIVEELDKVAGNLASNRFDGIVQRPFDLFADPGATTATATTKKFQAGEPSPFRRMNTYKTTKETSQAGTTATKDRSSAWHGEFGSISFGHVFAHYFSEIAGVLSSTDMADEFQVIFYKLNDAAGLVSGINIAEFPIDMSALESAYAKKVAEAKSERMSFDMFLEVVRQSQFGDIRHGAYGFRDLYKLDKGQLVLDEAKKSEMTKRLLGGEGMGVQFTLPAIEYFIETGHAANRSGDAALVDAIETLSSNDPIKRPGTQRRVVRIHIYDKASSPHKMASRIFKYPQGGFIEVDDDYMTSILGPFKDDAEALRWIAASIRERNPEIIEEIIAGGGDPSDTGFVGHLLGLLACPPNVDTSTPEARVSAALKGFDFNKAFRRISFGDGSRPVVFEDVKREIARLVPTLRMGSNGTMIQSVSYNTNQDALLSTIMMLRNTNASANPSQPNGSSDGSLPLRVVSGQLSVTTFGCPLVEYMQQFFVDLGTGTTIDNLYNITGLSHSMSPGKFSTEIKFTFADAYGQFESPQTFIDGVSSKFNLLASQIEAQSKSKKTS